MRWKTNGSGKDSCKWDGNDYSCAGLYLQRECYGGCETTFKVLNLKANVRELTVIIMIRRVLIAIK